MAETLIAGDWVSGPQSVEVRSPYSGAMIDTVPVATPELVERALAAAVDGARAMAAVPAHERSAILARAAELIEADVDQLARVITAEQGKHRADATAEASRIAGIVRLCAEEARRIYGELLPMDAAPVGVRRRAEVRRVPAGVMLAVTPFNYPAILVAHKIGPALAAGNAVILKPATATPLTALFLVERLVRAGLPPLALQCVIGSGSTVGEALVRDRRVRQISFTGSYPVGEAIARAAGVKRITCELGSNAVLVVLDDADVELACRAVVHSGYTNAGQNCVSTQRVLVPHAVRDEFLERLTERIDRLVPGDPADPATTLAPVINAEEAARVVDWIEQARAAGARVLRGGERDTSVVAPAVILDPPTDARVWRDELFGPAVAVRGVRDDDEALRMANDTRYGLAATVITRDRDRGERFAEELRAVIININSPEGSTWRADFMPWGGLGDSGFGKEGVRYAIEEMTERKLVVSYRATQP